MSSCQNCGASYFVKKPIAILCGHAICADCFHKENESYGVSCKLCGLIDTSFQGVVSHAVIEAMKELRVSQIERDWDKHGQSTSHDVTIAQELKCERDFCFKPKFQLRGVRFNYCSRTCKDACLLRV